MDYVGAQKQQGIIELWTEETIQYSLENRKSSIEIRGVLCQTRGTDGVIYKKYLQLKIIETKSKSCNYSHYIVKAN